MTTGFAIAVLACSLTGCLYFEPINERPEIVSISRLCSDGATCDQEFQDLHRGDSFALAASIKDPDGTTSDATYLWQASPCNADGTQCDHDAAYDGSEPQPTIMVPSALAATSGPVQLLEISLAVTDGRGAQTTKAFQITINDGPSLALREASRSHTVDGPVSLFATYSDPDGMTSQVAIDWTVSPPPGVGTSAYTLDAPTMGVPDGDDMMHYIASGVLTPHAVGTGWEVTTTATDSSGKATAEHVMFDIVADQPPCIAQLQPVVAPVGTLTPLSAPTVFSVPLVTDDLNPYPPVVDQPLLGTATFAWSILRPGATTWQVLTGSTGNSVELDPGAFMPDDAIGLRVEVSDPKHPTVDCPANQDTCGTPACSQRATWRVEAQ